LFISKLDVTTRNSFTRPYLMLHRSEMKHRPDSAKRRTVGLAAFRILTVLCLGRERRGRAN
jgi:hypothetical protein